MNTRRDFLKGVSLGAGGLLLNPWLHQIQAEAEGNANFTPRFVFVVEGNGLNPQYVHPVGLDYVDRNRREQLVDLALTNYELPESLQPINRYKDRVTLVHSLSGKVAGGGHSNDFGALGCYDCGGGVGNSGQAVDVTIDAALGQLHPGIFPIVNLGISDRPNHSVIYNCSASGPGQKLPTQCRPDLAYNTLFGSIARGQGAEQFQAGQDLLDFMVDDVRRAETRLGSGDRERLQSYLGGFESLRDRQQRLVEVRDRLARVAPVPDDKYQSAVETDRLDAQFEIAAAALLGRLTNVVTIASGVGNPYFSVTFRGLDINVGKHTLGHTGAGRPGSDAYRMCTRIRRFHFQLIARLMQQLESVREGDGTMLDNTLIVYMSDAAEAHHSRCWEWPFVLIGNLGGRLRAGNRYLAYPGYGKRGHRTYNSLYNTFLHAAGRPTNDFGHPDPMLRDLDQSGPLRELLA